LQCDFEFFLEFNSEALDTFLAAKDFEFANDFSALHALFHVLSFPPGKEYQIFNQGSNPGR
jgi:hypothetical protein